MKAKLTALRLVIALMACQTANGQSTQEKISVGSLTSQVMISSDFRSAVYLNLVGMGIRYTRNNLSISVSVFPTLRFHEDHPEPGEAKRPFVTPGFSVGPLFQYKRLLVGFPSSYRYDSRWRLTAGMGVKVGK